MNALASKFMSSTEGREDVISEAVEAAEVEGDLRSVGGSQTASLTHPKEVLQFYIFLWRVS